jgi:hypothetical protein
MDWIRLETDRPSRLLAPSRAPPPCMEGIDKLFQPPLNVRSISTTAPTDCSVGPPYCAQNTTIFSFPNEERLGTVSVACGGELVPGEACAAAALTALCCMRSCNSQAAQAVCDFLCVLPSELNDEASNARAVAFDDEEDGYSTRRAHEAAYQAHPLPATNNRSFLPGVGAASKRENERLSSAAGPHRSRCVESAGAARKLLSHLITFAGAVPLSSVFCTWSSSQLPGESAASAVRNLQSPSLDALRQGRASKEASALLKESALQRKLIRASLSVDRLWRHLCMSLLAASNSSAEGPGNALGPFCPATHFGAVFSSTGLVAASEHFFAVTTHWERVVLAALVSDTLLSRIPSSDIRCTEQPFRLSVPNTVSQLVVVTVGKCLSLVIAFRFAKKTHQVPPDCPAVASDYARFIASTSDDGRSGGAGDGSKPPVLDAMLGRAKLQTRGGKYASACGDLQLAGSGGMPITSSDDDNDDGASCGCITADSKQKKRRREASYQSEMALPFGFALCKYAVKIRRAETGLLANLCRADAVHSLSAHVATQSSVPWTVRCAARDAHPFAPARASAVEYASRTAFVTCFVKSLPTDLSARRLLDALRAVSDVLDSTEQGRAVCAISVSGEDPFHHLDSSCCVLAAGDSDGCTTTTAVAEQQAGRHSRRPATSEVASPSDDADTAVYRTAWRCTLLAGDTLDDVPPSEGKGQWTEIEKVLSLHGDAVLQAAMNLATQL